MTLLASNFDGSIFAFRENLAISHSIGKSEKFPPSSQAGFDVSSLISR
jgi:hypothetical protein